MKSNNFAGRISREVSKILRVKIFEGLEHLARKEKTFPGMNSGDGRVTRTSELLGISRQRASQLFAGDRYLSNGQDRGMSLGNLYQLCAVAGIEPKDILPDISSVIDPKILKALKK